MIDPTPSYNPTPERYRGGRLTRSDRAAMKAQAQAKLSAWMATPEAITRREAAMADARAALSFLQAPRRLQLVC